MANAPISEDDVARLTPYVAEANIFAMVDAMALGQGDKAIALMHRLLEDNPRDDGFGLYGMIVRQFRLLLIAKDRGDRSFAHGQPSRPRCGNGRGRHPDRTAGS